MTVAFVFISVFHGNVTLHYHIICMYVYIRIARPRWFIELKILLVLQNTHKPRFHCIRNFQTITMHTFKLDELSNLILSIFVTMDRFTADTFIRFAPISSSGIIYESVCIGSWTTFCSCANFVLYATVLWQYRQFLLAIVYWIRLCNNRSANTLERWTSRSLNDTKLTEH